MDVVTTYKILAELQREARRMGYKPDDALWTAVEMKQGDLAPDLQTAVNEVQYWMKRFTPQVPWPTPELLLEQNDAAREFNRQELLALIQESSTQITGLAGEIRLSIQEAETAMQEAVSTASASFSEMMTGLERSIVGAFQIPSRSLYAQAPMWAYYPLSCRSCHYWKGNATWLALCTH